MTPVAFVEEDGACDQVAVGVIGDGVRLVQGLDVILVTLEQARVLRDALNAIEENYS